MKYVSINLLLLMCFFHNTSAMQLVKPLINRTQHTNLFVALNMQAFKNLIRGNSRLKRYLSSTTHTTVKPWAAVEQKYRNALKKEEQELLAAILKSKNLSSQQFEQFKEQTKNEFTTMMNEIIPIIKTEKKYKHAIDPRVKQIFCEALKEQGIDNDNVHFVSQPQYPTRMYNAVMSATGTIDTKIVYGIRPGLLSFLFESDYYIKFLVLHEIQHTKNNDSYNNILLVNKVGLDEHSDLYEKYTLFMEKRANILAGLEDPQIAKEGMRLWRSPFARFFECITFQQYPIYRDAYKYMKILYKEMQESVKKNN